MRRPSPSDTLHDALADAGDDASLDASADASVDAAPVEVEAVRFSHDEAAYVTQLSWNHMTPAGAGRLLLVRVSTSYAGTPVSSVTYGSSALTRVGSRNANMMDGRVEIWRLVEPAVGTQQIVVTVDDTDSTFVAGAASFNNVDAVEPFGAFVGAAGTAGSPTVTVSSAPGEIVFDVVMFNGTYTTLDVGPGQQQRWNESASVQIGGASTEVGAANVVMTWDVTGDFNDYWAIGAVADKP